MGIIEWWTGARELVNTIAAAVIVLLIGFIIGKICGKLTQRGLHEVEINRILKKAGVRFSLEEFVGRIIEYIIYFIAVVIALDQLGVTTFVLYIIIAAVILILAITLLLSIRDFIPNFIAGLRLSHKKPFSVGDTITVGSVSGKVKEINLLETKLTHRKDIIHLPNSTILKQNIKVKKR